MKYIFSFPSARYLYECFIKDRELEVTTQIIGKKLTSRNENENKTILYYSLYGRNLHKIYSPEFDIEEFEDNICSVTTSNTYSSTNISTFKYNRHNNPSTPSIFSKKSIVVKSTISDQLSINANSQFGFQSYYNNDIQDGRSDSFFCSNEQVQCNSEYGFPT
jgi:hypothetical protein